jgi:hypothetical protein
MQFLQHASRWFRSHRLQVHTPHSHSFRFLSFFARCVDAMDTSSASAPLTSAKRNCGALPTGRTDPPLAGEEALVDVATAEDEEGIAVRYDPRSIGRRLCGRECGVE